MRVSPTTVQRDAANDNYTSYAMNFRMWPEGDLHLNRAAAHTNKSKGRGPGATGTAFTATSSYEDIFKAERLENFNPAKPYPKMWDTVPGLLGQAAFSKKWRAMDRIKRKQQPGPQSIRFFTKEGQQLQHEESKGSMAAVVVQGELIRPRTELESVNGRAPEARPPRHRAELAAALRPEESSPSPSDVPACVRDLQLDEGQAPEVCGPPRSALGRSSSVPLGLGSRPSSRGSVASQGNVRGRRRGR
mmetsp:Transcript_36168/g.104073  ORF Transcript_36168/g.104073 Transcript_36168/m.104073 type:complete len:246 (+) Transcript_36168:49-786(+)